MFHSFTMGTVCLKCGDRGFPETLVFCMKCQAYALHRYCLDGPVIFLDEVTWFCEDCEAKLAEPSSLDQSIPVSSETGDSISLATDASKERKELRNCINRVKKSKKLAPKMIKKKHKKRKVSNQQQQNMTEEVKQKKRKFSDQWQQQMTVEENQKKRKVSNKLQQKMTEEEKQMKKRVSNQHQQKMTEEEQQMKKRISSQQQQKVIEEDKQMKKRISKQHQQKMTEEENRQKKRKVSSQQQPKVIEEDKQMKTQDDPSLVAKTYSHSLPQPGHAQYSDCCEERSKLKNECEPLPIEAANSNVRSESVQDSLEATNDDLNCAELDNNIYAQPIAKPVWRGSLNISNETIGILNLLAHMSSLACYKVQKETKLLPEVLCADLLPRSVVWPKSFKNGGPTDRSIALYFFPDNERDEKAFDKLVDDAIQLELAIRVIAENAELLIFPSTALPMKDRRIQAKYYLWGVFSAKQNFK